MSEMAKGVLLPVITPFTGGKVDIETYKKLLVHYLGKGIHGLIPLGTTGESPTVEEDEYNRDCGGHNRGRQGQGTHLRWREWQ